MAAAPTERALLDVVVLEIVVVVVMVMSTGLVECNAGLEPESSYFLAWLQDQDLLEALAEG